jgi:hypothetical protein
MDPTHLQGLVTSLGPVAQEALGRYFATDDPAERERLLRQLSGFDYREQPADPHTFLFDERYFGHIGKDLWDSWTEDLTTVMTPERKIYEWILTGAIGIGKTTVSLCAMAYKIHRLLCLRDPYEYYDQAKINRFYFGCYNVYKYKGRELYDKLKTAINASPWFQRRFPINPRLKDTMEFPETVSVIPGASELDALGENLVACHLSEVNFMKLGASDEDLGQAWGLYRSAQRRIKSRFMHKGSSPGLVILDSSRRAETDMLEQHLKIAQDDPHTIISEGAIWDYRPKEYFTGEWFQVSVGDQVRNSRILEADEVAPPGLQVVDVPEEYRKDFAADCDGALRDIAGVATFAVSPFFPNREWLRRSIDPVVKHPFTQDSIVLGTDDDYELIDFFDREELLTIVRGRYSPRNAPGRLRFIHGDLARSQDAAALAMGYVEAVEWITTTASADDIDAPIMIPHIRVEMMVRIPPPLYGEIDYSKIRRFLSALREMGFPIGKVTFDGFQSVDMCQILRRMGFDADQQSMDRAPCSQYQLLRSAVTENRIRWYDYPVFLTEAGKLKKDIRTGKVDHPKGGSKDVADCVAGVVALCSTEPGAMGDPDQIPVITPGRDDQVPTSAPVHMDAPFGVRQLLGSSYKG